MLAEASTTEISKKKNPKGIKENMIVAKEGGSVAGKARKDLEERTGRSVITGQNAKLLKNK